MIPIYLGSIIPLYNPTQPNPGFFFICSLGVSHFMVLNLPFGDGLPEATEEACCTRKSIRSKRWRTLVWLRNPSKMTEHWEIGNWRNGCVSYTQPKNERKSPPEKAGAFFFKGNESLIFHHFSIFESFERGISVGMETLGFGVGYAPSHVVSRFEFRCLCPQKKAASSCKFLMLFLGTSCYHQQTTNFASRQKVVLSIPHILGGPQCQ